MQVALSCSSEQKRNLPKLPKFASFSPTNFIVKNMDPNIIWDTTKAVCQQLCAEAKADYTVEIQSVDEKEFKIKLIVYSASESGSSQFEVTIFSTEKDTDYMVESHHYSGERLLFYEVYYDFLKLMNEHGLVRITSDEFQKKREFLCGMNPETTSYELSDIDIDALCTVLSSEYIDVFQSAVAALIEHMYVHGAECTCFVKEGVPDILVGRMGNSSFEVVRLAVTALFYLSRSAKACQMLKKFKKDLEAFAQFPNHHAKIKSKVDTLLANMAKNDV